MRMLRFVPFLFKFRFLVLACANSLSALFWPLVLLSLLTFTFSLVFVTSLTAHVEVSAADRVLVEDIRTYFRDLPTSMLTLFMSITGGVNYIVVVEILGEVSALMVIFFLLFFILSSMAVMNVITSIFVSDAIEVAQQDRDIRMRADTERWRRQLAIFTELWNEVDTNGSGTISCAQLEVAMKRPEVVALFNLFELDIIDVVSFFESLDTDHSGHVGREEFVTGCLRMRGHGNLLDIETSIHDVKRLARDMWKMQKSLFEQRCRSPESSSTLTDGSAQSVRRTET